MDSPSSSLLQDDHLSSLRRRNKILIIAFFSLIFLLALITGGIIISLLQQINSDPTLSNPAIREFCSPYEHLQPHCATLLSSQIKAPSNTNPNHVFLLSLETSLQKLSIIDPILSDPELASGNCSSSLGRTAGQLRIILDSLRVDPNVQTYDRRDMITSMDTAAGDLDACISDLGRAESTAAEGVAATVYDVRAVVIYGRDFLYGCDVVNGNFYSVVFASKRMFWDELVENLMGVSLFGLQYFVLVFLFCLLLRS